MFGKLLGSARRKAEISRKERLLKEAQILSEVAASHLQLGRALMKARETGADLAAWSIPTKATSSTNWSAGGNPCASSQS